MRNDSFLSFVVGVAAGSVLGILFAPEKGEVTRRKIKDAAIEGYDNACEKASEAYQYARSKAEKLAKDIEELKAILMEDSREMKEEARARMLDQLDRIEAELSKEDE